MSKASMELMEELHKITTKDLIEKISSGEATSADLNAAIKLMKDNGVSLLGEVNQNTDALSEAFLKAGGLPVDVHNIEDHIN